MWQKISFASYHLKQSKCHILFVKMSFYYWINQYVLHLYLWRVLNVICYWCVKYDVIEFVSWLGNYGSAWQCHFHFFYSESVWIVIKNKRNDVVEVSSALKHFPALESMAEWFKFKKTNIRIFCFILAEFGSVIIRCKYHTTSINHGHIFVFNM